MAEESIEALTKRYNELNARKIKAETNLESAEKRLAELKAEAKTTYGTDDLDELRQKLAEMEQANETARTAYQQKLDAIEADLKKVESEQNA